MRTRKSWKEKLKNSKGLPRIVKLEGKMQKKWGEGTMVIPSPMDVNAIMKKVPKGKLITLGQIRDVLARHYGTTIACPLTTGIFVKIAAFAAEEERKEGEEDITPYWRTIRNDGTVDKKFPISDEEIAEILRHEGIPVEKTRTKYRVKNFKAFLVDSTKIKL